MSATFCAIDRSILLTGCSCFAFTLFFSHFLVTSAPAFKMKSNFCNSITTLFYLPSFLTSFYQCHTDLFFLQMAMFFYSVTFPFSLSFFQILSSNKNLFRVTRLFFKESLFPSIYWHFFSLIHVSICAWAEGYFFGHSKW